MSEHSKENKLSFIKGVQAEYRKIIWPGREMLKKETVAVIMASISLGIVISILDYIFQMGFRFIIK